MDAIVKRLLENKQILDTNIFNASDNSDDAWDVYGQIDDIVKSAVRRISDDIDVDDTGLDSRGSISGDRAIIYRALVGRFNKRSPQDYTPIKSREWDRLKSDLENSIRLPDSDDQYDYTIRISYSGTTLEITLRREERVFMDAIIKRLMENHRLDNSKDSDDQIGEYHIYSPAVRGDLYITVYDVYGDIEYYVFEPGDTESIRFDDLGELCDIYKLDPDDFEDNEFGGN